MTTTAPLTKDIGQLYLPYLDLSITLKKLPGAHLSPQNIVELAVCIRELAANGLLLLKSLGTKWNWTNGFLVEWKPAPDIKKLLQPRKFAVEWESIVPQPS